MLSEAWRRLSQAERDAAYDNTNAVPEAEAVATDRRAQSDHLRRTHPGFVDLAYGATPRQRWDIFQAQDRAAPWLVFIHGGYWQKNGREDFSAVALGLLAHGWSVALPGYTLAPEAALPQIVGEIGEALDVLDQYRAALGFGGHLTLSGWSAGATLAALHMHRQSVARGLLLSGLYDLGPLCETNLNNALGLDYQQAERHSPLRQPLPSKPLTIACGSEELPALKHQSRAFADRLASDGQPATFIELDGANHFTVLNALISPVGQLATLLAGEVSPR